MRAVLVFVFKTWIVMKVGAGVIGSAGSIFGGTEFTTRTLRFAWHLCTVAWWAAAALFFSMAQAPLTSARVSLILGVMFLASAILTCLVSRGRHLAWPVFLAIAVIALYGAYT